MTQQPANAQESGCLAVAKLAIVGIVLWAVGDTLWSGLVTLWTDGLANTLALDCCCWSVIYLVGLLPAGLFWWRVLWVLGQKTRFLDTMRAYYIGHLGKYVPGKAMVVVLRAGLLQPSAELGSRSRPQRCSLKPLP